MRALFIGGTGNVSHAVSRAALASGVELWLLNRQLTTPALPGARQLTAYIADEAQVSRLIHNQRFDCVVNFVAFTASDAERDIRLFRNIAEQYVFVSSAAVYEKPAPQPFITEGTPLSNPHWAYARDKIAAERRLQEAQREDGFPVTIVRPSLTYDTVLPIPLAGWRDYTVADRMLRGAPVVVHGDGTSLFTITHAGDFAQGLLGLLGNRRSVGEAYHITSDEALTWDQIYGQLAAALGIQPWLVHVPSDFIAAMAPARAGSLLGDKAHTQLYDNSKLKAAVPGFRANVPFREGIARTLRWFAESPERCRTNPASDALVDKILDRYARAFPEALSRIAPLTQESSV